MLQPNPAVPGWLLLHPVSSTAATRVSLGEGDSHPLPPGNALAPEVGFLKSLPAILQGCLAQVVVVVVNLAVEASNGFNPLHRPDPSFTRPNLHLPRVSSALTLPLPFPESIHQHCWSASGLSFWYCSWVLSTH